MKSNKVQTLGKNSRELELHCITIRMRRLLFYGLGHAVNVH